MYKLRIKTGDKVKILAGKDKGKEGKVIQVFPKQRRVVVEGVNAAKKHLRTRSQGQKGQVIEFFMPIDSSNVQPLDAEGKAVRHSKKLVS
ncbi:MAG: 50S ribosomal protein L24 [Patescibacteria group bacterium]|jgi:large subunit ribosomal protein L24